MTVIRLTAIVAVRRPRCYRHIKRVAVAYSETHDGTVRFLCRGCAVRVAAEMISTSHPSD